jgi:formylglycine-generating enzyme required for sulfatase activity
MQLEHGFLMECNSIRRLVLISFLVAIFVTTVVIVVYFCMQRNSVEIRTIRYQAASGDLDRLANLLDQSMAVIPAGEFIMGSDENHEDEHPRHQVYLYTFELDRYEVTNSQYLRFALATGTSLPRYWFDGKSPPGQADFPVVGVSWKNAQSYCKWVKKRLPTEAEWEKACRGPEGRLYPWGSEWDPSRANVGYMHVETWPSSLEDGWSLLQIDVHNTGFPSLYPVGSFPLGASFYGVLDLVGNTSEWMADWYNWDGYWDLPLTNPIGLGPPWNHSIRGSGWFDRCGQEGEIADLSRCSARNSSHSYDDPRLGFRCAR